MPTIKYHTAPARKVAAELAVNLADLDRLRQETRTTLLAGKVATDGVVNPTGECKDVAVRFTCTIEEAALLCDVLRSYDKASGDRPTRVLIRDDPESPWRAVPPAENLTYVDSKTHKVRLNPRVFPVDGTEIVPMPTRPVEWK